MKQSTEAIKGFKAVASFGDTCKYIVFDAQNISGIDNFLLEAEQKFNGEKIFGLVSNAGISLHEGNFRNVTEEG